MKRVLWLVVILGCTAVFAAEEQSAAAIMQHYLALPFPAEDRLGEARTVRLRTLDELRAMPEAAVHEVTRVLPEVTDSRQRAELAETLRHFPTKESAAMLCELLDDPEAQVRFQAIHSLRLLARRVDRIGGKRTQRGEEFAPKVDGLVPYLIKAASDKVEQNRIGALFALADTLDPAAIAEIRRRLTDESDNVRFHAACFLAEFQDASGLGEMKKALERFRSAGPSEWAAEWNTEPLLASFERITGKSFGPVLMNPGLSSDGRVAETSRRRYKELLDTWAAWWAWEPAAANSAARPQAEHSQTASSSASIPEALSATVSAELAKLQSTNLNERSQALLRLRRRDAAAAIPALIRMLGSEAEFPQRLLLISSFAPITQSCSHECTFGGEAAETLARIGVLSDELLALLKSPDWRTRANAARALGGLKDTRAAGDLIALLSRPDEPWQVKGNAALALGLLRDDRSFPPGRLREPGAIPVALSSIEESRSVQSLLTALKDQNAPVRAAAARALAPFQAAGSLQPLIAALKDPDPGVRQNAVGSLGRFDGAESLEALILALHDEERTVREVAAGALGRLKDARATGALLAALKDPYVNVQINAAGALGQLRSAEALDPLIGLLASDEDAVRGAAAAALGELGDARARDPLLDLVLGQSRLKIAPSVSTSTNGLSVTIVKREIRSEITLLRGLHALAKLGLPGASAALAEYNKHRPDWKEWWSQNQNRLLKP